MITLFVPEVKEILVGGGNIGWLIGGFMARFRLQNL